MGLENVTWIFIKSLAHVGKKLETKFDRYLHNKKILEYAQVLVTDGRFMIFDIEGHSKVYNFIHFLLCNTALLNLIVSACLHKFSKSIDLEALGAL